jgi:hypothetical protein
MWCSHHNTKIKGKVWHKMIKLSHTHKAHCTLFHGREIWKVFVVALETAWLQIQTLEPLAKCHRASPNKIPMYHKGCQKILSLKLITATETGATHSQWLILIITRVNFLLMIKARNLESTFFYALYFSLRVIRYLGEQFVGRMLMKDNWV